MVIAIESCLQVCPKSLQLSYKVRSWGLVGVAGGMLLTVRVSVCAE